ncbi:DUF924 family protein [Rhodospirillum sp. A1_3_36]|uniref:DUF924 family protein n=1 Tax=Rhodospirillum sp. A1_3_36 TaxID=3391666 RepID=UPI0039A75F32
MMDHIKTAMEMDGEAPVEDRVLTLWFGAEDDPTRHDFKPWWFQTSDALDATLIALFTKAVGDAIAGRLDHLAETPRGTLALIILLDQFPRNIWRGRDKAFSGDAKARALAQEVIKRGYDREYAKVERLFCYLPFEHSEDLVDQERSLALFERLEDKDVYDYALRHYEIIARFGRFPHRNAALGRETTEEEAKFLLEPGSSF